MSRAPVLVMAGGTGGHVFPALAVADALRADGWPVVWLGTRHGLEARVVPAHGFDIEWIEVSGLRGKGWRTLFAAPLRLLGALADALGVMRRHRPAVVLGMGGYIAGPGGLASWLTRTPLVIHEQNSVAGLTNRILAPLARRVLTGFPDVLGKGEWAGNPVRADIAALAPPEARMASRTGPLRVLVFGGSQGARVLNEMVPAAVAALPADARPAVRHQCGHDRVEAARAAWRAHGLGVEPEAFIDDMAAAYAWADLVICRAGALTVAELAAAGVASVLVPYPHAVDDHQTGNALFLSRAGAAEVVPQHEFDAERLAGLIGAFDRARLLRMARAARTLGKPDASARVAHACVEASGTHPGGGAA